MKTYHELEIERLKAERKDLLKVCKVALKAFENEKAFQAKQGGSVSLTISLAESAIRAEVNKSERGSV